jgi:hypothetical protein
MGGRGSGGPRVGAGRKRKDADAVWLGGNAGKRHGRKKPKAPAPFALLASPDYLTEPERSVWESEASHAAAARTLTPGTAAEFADFCKAVVIERKLLAQIERDGWTHLDVTVDGAGTEHNTIKKHPLVSDHRQWMQRVEQKRLRFKLSPMGKEIEAPEKPTDEWAEFDDKAPERVN